MRYKITVEYEGTHLVGWQKQKDGASAQEFLEKAILGFSQPKCSEPDEPMPEFTLWRKWRILT